MDYYSETNSPAGFLAGHKLYLSNFQETERIFAADFVVAVLRNVTVCDRIVKEVCENEPFILIRHADIRSEIQAVFKFFKELIPKLRVTHNGVLPASCRHIAVEIGIFSHKLNHASAGGDFAGRVSVAIAYISRSSSGVA